MTLDLRKTARHLADKSGEAEADWLQSLNRAYKVVGQQGLNDEEFDLVASSCSQKAHFDLIIREFFKFTRQDAEHRSAYKLFFKEVDESEFEIEQWIEAIVFMYGWLDKKEKMAPLDTIFGYLNCCAMAPDNKMGQRRFKAIVSEFIDLHGFERAKPVNS